MKSTSFKKIKQAISNDKEDDTLVFEKDSSDENIVKAITNKNGHQRVVRLYVLTEEDFDKISMDEKPLEPGTKAYSL